MVRFIGEFGNVGERPGQDGRLDAPAFHRNHQPIWSVLCQFLHGKAGDVLEVGSGTGQHIVEFARHTPDLVWWPSDNDRMHLESIAAWRLHSTLPNVRPPATIDLSEYRWKLPHHEMPGPSQLLAILCINVLHIAPWRASESLLGGAARYLRPDGRMFVYGPFMRNGKHTAPSNAEFDGYLRGSNVEWGIRDIEALASLADRVELTITEVVDMPANNLILIFERTTKM